MSASGGKLRVRLAQVAPRFGDLDANLEMPLEAAKEFVRRNPGHELFGVMREADGE